MISIHTLLFPDTGVFHKQSLPLLLFCKPLHYLQVGKIDIEYAEKEGYTPLFKDGLLKAHPPASLEAKQKQFLESLEMCCKEEYPASAANGVKTIVSYLREHEADLVDAGGKSDLLKAQVTLTIAEIVAYQKENLEEHLYFLGAEDLNALSSLAAESDSNVQAMITGIQEIVGLLKSQSSESSGRRFEAWLRLLREQELPPIRLWLASSRPSGEEIFNRYTATSKGDYVPLLKLALPAHFLESPSYVIQHILEFQKATTDIHRGLVADFDRILTSRRYERGSKDFLLPYGTDWADQWEIELDTYFPESNYGRSAINFFLLPHQLIGQLLSVSGADDAGAGAIYHGLLGIHEDS